MIYILCLCISVAPSPPNVELVRYSDNQFNIKVSLAYIGGGELTQLTVAYKQVLRQREWPDSILVDIVPTGNSLEWTAVVRNEEGFEPGTEFRITALNDRGYASSPAVQLEPTGEFICVLYLAIFTYYYQANLSLISIMITTKAKFECVDLYLIYVW